MIEVVSPGQRFTTTSGLGWWRTKDGIVMMACPSCSHPASLEDHFIAPDGAVSPSVECGNANCQFHGYVVLQEFGTDKREQSGR